MKHARALKKIMILVIVLAVPGFLYYLLTAEGKNRYKPLPIFGPKQLAKTYHRVKGRNIPDTIYHTIPNFNLTDQNGDPVSLKTFENKIMIAGFFYTRCPTVCRVINKYVSQLDSVYAKNKRVNFVSITVDPGYDIPQVLKNYAKSFKASPKWLFLTGDTTAIFNLARNGFLVNAVQADKNEFIYSDKLILIDPERRIRGFYTGASTTDVNRLDDEIKVLISEGLRKKDEPLY